MGVHDPIDFDALFDDDDDDVDAAGPEVVRRPARSSTPAAPDADGEDLAGPVAGLGDDRDVSTDSEDDDASAGSAGEVSNTSTAEDMAPEPDDDTTVEDSRHAGLDLVTDDFHEDIHDDLHEDIHDDLTDDNPVEAQAQALNDAQAQHAALDALRVVLLEFRDHLVRTVAWVDEVMDALEVSRGDE